MDNYLIIVLVSIIPMDLDEYTYLNVINIQYFELIQLYTALETMGRHDYIFIKIF